MPKLWYDRHAIKNIEDENIRLFYQNIVADKKPYFMRYIYPDLMRKYNTYIKNTERNALREFKMSVCELKNINEENLTEDQSLFVKNYDKYMPVGVGNCVMNKICRRFENEFDGYISKHSGHLFDYTIMKSGSEYSPAVRREIQKLYSVYNNKLQSYAALSGSDGTDDLGKVAAVNILNDEFRRDCSIACPNSEMLCDVILDVCYGKKSTKKFAWSVCGGDIVRNLLANNNYKISFPTMDPDGDISYGGRTFSVKTIEVSKE